MSDTNKKIDHDALLDARLQQAMAELQDRSAAPSLSDGFDDRLLQAIRSAAEPAVAGDYVRRLERKERLRNFADSVIRGERPFLAIAAVALLFLGGLSPFALQRLQGPTLDTPPGHAKGIAPTMGGAEDERQQVAAPPAEEAPAGDAAQSRSFDAVHLQIELLEERLAAAQTPAERIQILEKLEQAYRNAGRESDANRAREERAAIRP